jgi:cytoskeletal protein CcmA (bactofilin family)
MFSKGKIFGAESKQVGGDRPMPSIVSSNLRIHGDLESDGDIQVEGIVEGDVRSHTIIVGDSATIRGDITGEAVHVRGSVTGSITARTVTLASSSRVVGNVLHESLSIEPGAFLDGECRHVEAEPLQDGAAAELTDGAGEAEEDGRIDMRESLSG